MDDLTRLIEEVLLGRTPNIDAESRTTNDSGSGSRTPRRVTQPKRQPQTILIVVVVVVVVFVVTVVLVFQKRRRWHRRNLQPHLGTPRRRHHRPCRRRQKVRWQLPWLWGQKREQRRR